MRKLFSLTALLLLITLFIGADPTRPDLTVYIPMRDGKQLATDIYLPSPDARNLPCLLVRSPAGRKAQPALSNIHFVKSGFMLAIQETRSAADAEGKTMPCIDDGWGQVQDGYDTVEWLAQSKLTNGKIGTVGPSALGITQLMLAPTSPSALKAQYIQFACGSIFHHAAYPQGQLHKHQIESWLEYYAKDPCHNAKIRKERQFNNFWSCFDSNSRAHQVKVPSVFIGGWFDTFLQGTVESFQSRQERGGEGARGEQKLVIGPWAHFWPTVTKIGDFEVPYEAQRIPDSLDPVKWFNHYLKGEVNHVEDSAPVTYYVMGPFDGSASKGNRWKTSQTWPVPSKEACFYLTAEGGLRDKQPEAYDKFFQYIYDPANPSPTIGGKNLFLDSGPMDQRPIEARADVVVFTTPELQEDLEVTGRMKAKIYLSTECDDTDLVLRLTDVYPDGRSILISDNNVRVASIYNDTRSISCKENPTPHEVEVDLHPTSIVFAKGHKIRLSITSSNYPRFEKNLNVRLDENGNPCGNPRIARNNIWVGLRTPSRLILPVIQ